MKLCKKCGEDNQLNFHSNNNTCCKTCKSEYNKEYKLKNKDKTKVYNAIWSEENRVERKEYKKKYRSENKDSINTYNKSWYNQIPENKKSFKLKDSYIKNLICRRKNKDLSDSNLSELIETKRLNILIKREIK